MNEYPMGPGFFIFFQETQILGGAGYPIIYEYLPKKTIRKVIRKIKRYKKKRIIDEEAIERIVASMVKEWPEEEKKEKMIEHDQTEDQAIWSYKQTLYLLINDDDLAIILILASI